MARLAAFVIALFLVLSVGSKTVEADHNIYLPLVPNTPIIQEAFSQNRITYCLNARASTYPNFAAQVEDVTDRYRALGFTMTKVAWGSGCELQHNMADFECGGCAAHVFYANWPVVIEYKYTLGYTDWRSAVGHELGHALLGLHERYRDSGGNIGCVGPESGSTVMDCGAPHTRYPQPLDVQRFCALPGAGVMAGCIPIQTLIRSYDWEDDIALDVFFCESSYNPLAVGGLLERGIAQIHPVHIGQIDWENAFNPKVNLDYAYALWLQRGWQPWSCYDPPPPPPPPPECGLVGDIANWGNGVTAQWNTCDDKWHGSNGWKFIPNSDDGEWEDPTGRLIWGDCDEITGYRWNFDINRWVSPGADVYDPFLNIHAVNGPCN